MSLTLRLYQQITHGVDENARFNAVAEAIEALEQRLADQASLATREDVHATELRLQKEIEQIRLRTEQVRGEIEQVRGEIKAVELRLQKEIAEVRGEIKTVELNLRKEIEQVRLEVKSVEVRLVTALHRQTLWIIGAVGSVVAMIRLLDFLLA